MDILYNETKTIKEVYSYVVNQGGDLNIRASNGSDRVVHIIFEDNQFKEVVHNMAGDFEGSRSYWHVMGGISAKITELEQSYKEKYSSEDLPF